MPRPEFDREQGYGEVAHEVPSRAVVPAPPAAAVRPWGEPARGSNAVRKPVPLNNTPDPISMLVAFRRRWVLALSMGLLAMLTAGTLAYTLIPQAKFVAQAVIMVKNQQPRFFTSTNEATEQAESFRSGQVFLLTSSNVLNGALRNAKVSKLKVVTDQIDPKLWLKSEIKVKSIGEYLEVSMGGDNPEEVSTILRAVIEAYQEEAINKTEKPRAERLNKLRDAVEKYETNLKDKRKFIREISENLGANSPVAIQAANAFNQERLGGLKAALSEVTLTKTRAEVRLKVLESQREAVAAQGNGAAATVEPVADDLTDEQLEELLSRDQAYAQLQNAFQKASKKYGEINRIVRDKSDPSVRNALNAYQAARADVENRVAMVRKQALKALAAGGLDANGAPANGPDEIQSLRLEVAINTDLENAYKAQIEALEGTLKVAAGQAVDLEKEKTEVAVVEEMTKKMRAEIEAVEIEQNAEGRVILAQGVEAPKSKDNSKHLKLCLAASGGAFVFAVLGVSFWEFRARRVNSVDEVVTTLGMNLVGALPALPNRRVGRRSQSQALEDRAWQNMLVESVDATRTMLLHMSRVEGLHSVMICSAMKGEGKTSLSVHLATSLARAGQRTLLIDCDLRSPSVNKLYDLAVEPGLCEYLRNEVSLEEVLVNVIRQAPVGELDIIPAGRYDAIALQSLARDGVRNLIDAVKGTYDFVIVDSAPILPVADTLLLSQQVDAVLFSVLRDVSRLNHVHAAHERVSNLGVRILGAVVNGAPRTSTYGMYPYT